MQRLDSGRRTDRTQWCQRKVQLAQCCAPLRVARTWVPCQVYIWMFLADAAHAHRLYDHGEAAGATRRHQPAAPDLCTRARLAPLAQQQNPVLNL